MDSDQVTDAKTFAAFVNQLRAELDDPKRSEEWENTDLPTFLEAMAAWAGDWQKPAESNPWRHAANLLVAASIYE
jgi:hypothetical protein